MTKSNKHKHRGRIMRTAPAGTLTPNYPAPAEAKVEPGVLASLGEEIERLQTIVRSLKKQLFIVQAAIAVHVTPLTPLPVGQLPRKARRRRFQ